MPTLQYLSNGYILLLVLLFLQLISLLGLYGLSTARLNLKANNDKWQHLLLDRNIPIIFQEITVFKTINRTACQIEITSIEQLKQKPLSWWEQQGCQGFSYNMYYDYVIEPLGSDPCAYIKNSLAIADYYRITLLVKQDDMLLVQATIVAAAQPLSQCLYIKHTVQSGLQAWKEI